MRTTLERFEAFFIPEPMSGCWIWLGGVQEKGYGQFWYKKRMKKAAVVAWELYRGSRNGLHVLHDCDNRLCVNPEHLHLGTHQDNIAEREARGRGARGQKNGKSVITDAEASAILHDLRPAKEIMWIYNVSESTVRQIKSRRIWKHVT